MKIQVVCTLSFLATALAAQENVSQPAFEVASIKPADPGLSNPLWAGIKSDQTLVRYSNVTLRDCIRAAWRVRDFQIQGPPWISDSRYEIVAKLGSRTQDQIPEMLQSLLVERFKLNLRHEKKELPVYTLMIGKGGSSLKLAAETKIEQMSTALGPDGKPRAAMSFRILKNGVSLHAPSASLAAFVELVSRFTERPVIDRTNLKGQFDITLDFSPETWTGLPSEIQAEPRTTGEPGPSVFAAFQQYGLKLEPRKEEVDILTVVHAEKTPLEN
jgi:uncharacterized protein (TIGR03435 family)